MSPSYGKYGVLVTNGCIYRIWEVLWGEGVQLWIRKTLILLTQREGDIFHMKLINNTGKFTKQFMRCIKRFRMYARVYLLSCITTGYEIHWKTEYQKFTTQPQKIFSGCPVTGLGGQEKALWKEAMRIITPQNGNFIQPMGKWTRTGHIKE